jgi:serine protease Do
MSFVGTRQSPTGAIMKKSNQSLTQAARLAAKSVVRLQVHGYADTNVQSILDPRVVIGEDWTGSGFFVKVGKESGYILTNCHVALNARHIEIQSILTSDELFRVEVVGVVMDMEPDVALLKFSRGEKNRFLKLSSEKKIPCLQLGDSKTLRRSEAIRAIGYPLGMSEPNISGGEISNFISGNDETIERLVTDAPINPGNSGGPSIVASGKVIGLNTAVVIGANNIGFITPIHLVKKVLTRLDAHRTTGICQLAAAIQKNSPANATWLKMKKPDGVIVVKIYPRGLAAALGLKSRDVILEINGFHFDRYGNVRGEKIYRKRNIFDILYEIPIGDVVKMRIFRNGKEITLQAEAIGWAGDEFPRKPKLSERRYACVGGLVLQEACSEVVSALSTVGLNRELAYRQYAKNKSKLILTAICDDTPAMDLDLGLGDFLIKLDGLPVKSLVDLQRALERSRKKRPHSDSFLMEFSSGSIANFPKACLTDDALKIHRYGEKGT